MNHKRPTYKSLGVRDLLDAGAQLPFREKATAFSRYMDGMHAARQDTYLREVVSPADREVLVRDPFTKDIRRMLMFASNNYLGAANHPHVLERIRQGIREYGVGLGGPPLLNGYSRLMRELEERLSAHKQKEDTMLFSSGYLANLALASALPDTRDRFLYDELHHASFRDGTRLGRGAFEEFPHNDTAALEQCLTLPAEDPNTTTFVTVEGVYSMDGDLCPLPEVVRLCKEHDSVLVLDDAHGTGVLGETGAGTAEHFGLENDVEILMGTFSKAIAMTGAYISASKEIIKLLRYLARPYIFSAALPPVSLLAVHGAMDLIEQEPERRQQLRDNVRYLTQRLGQFDFAAPPEAAIVSVLAPAWMNLRAANYAFHQKGIFLSAIEYPAVPENAPRFRVSVIANHTRADLDTLATAFEEVWADPKTRKEGG
jgi:glycine C-acetyltransferase